MGGVDLFDPFDLGDLVESIRDVGYAAGAAGEFSLAAAEYRAAYAKLYDIYRDMADARQRVETRGQAMTPREVSPVISGVLDGSVQARRVLAATGSGLTSHLRSLEAQLAGILNGMHAAYNATVVTDRQGAQTIQQAGR